MWNFWFHSTTRNMLRNVFNHFIYIRSSFFSLSLINDDRFQSIVSSNPVSSSNMTKTLNKSLRFERRVKKKRLERSFKKHNFCICVCLLMLFAWTRRTSYPKKKNTEKNASNENPVEEGMGEKKKRWNTCWSSLIFFLFLVLIFAKI